jgi:RNA polymerase sigma-70 factor, ECF subfamily
MEPLTDLELVNEVRAGNRRAYTELMHRYQEKIYWVARRMLGNHADADDVVQEAFLKAFMSLGDFRGDSGFYTWLYRIAVNLSLNALRKRHVVEDLRESELAQKIFPPAKDDPHKELEARELESRLLQAVAKLPDKQRAVFVLRYYDEMSYEEISYILKTSVGGLKANYFHALRKVQRSLKHALTV